MKNIYFFFLIFETSVSTANCKKINLNIVPESHQLTWSYISLISAASD